MSQQEAMDLEKHLISPIAWHTVPRGILHLAENARGGDEQVPIGIGRGDMGYFILSTGQGPSIVWREWVDKTIPCMYCEYPTRMYTTMQCDGCHAVDIHIDDFVKSTEGKLRVLEAITASLGGKTE